MANKWAIQNGNWSDGSTWNDGVVPTADDDVSSNGFIVTIVTSSIDAKNITNDGGGYFTSILSGLVVNANLINRYVSNTTTYVLSNPRSTTINGNLQGQNVSSTINGYAFYCNSNYNENQFVINGDIGNSSLYFLNANKYVTIIGNIECTESPAIQAGTNITVNITGNINSNTSYVINNNVRDLSITGDINITDSNGRVCNTCSTFVFDGHYMSSGNLFPTNSINNLFISDGSVIRWRDVYGNQLDLIANSIENYKYPEEKDVKEGVSYGMFDEYTGTYQINYPQEANVMEGVEYGDGYVGTLSPVQGTIVESGTVVNLTQDQINRIAESITAEMAQTMLQQYFG